MNSNKSESKKENISFRPDPDQMAEFLHRLELLDVRPSDFAKVIFKHGISPAYAELARRRSENFEKINLDILKDQGDKSVHGILVDTDTTTQIPVTYPKPKRSKRTK